MAINKDAFNSQKISEYSSLLKSDKFLEYIQSRINYDISKIKRQYFNYVEEAEYGVRLLSKFDIEGKRILEVGSGAGILTAWMLINGVDIIGIEPSALGFDFHNDIFTAIWDYFKLPKDRIYDLTAEQLDPDKIGKFHIIFSVNVMEHIPTETLELAFEKMGAVMHENGFMYHHCPNYSVPFEPHYGVPLVPYFPHIMGKITGLDKHGLWQSVNFITLPQVKRISRKLGLKVEFQKGVMAEAFDRLEYDKEFAARHPALTKMYDTMKKVGIIAMFRAIPPRYNTPMTFTISK